MKNLVGHKRVSSVVFKTFVAGVMKLMEMVAGFTYPDLTAQDRKRMLKMRPGGEKVIMTVTEIALWKGITLTIPIDDIRKDAELADQLEEPIRVLRDLLRLLVDTQLQARSEAWHGTTAYYTALARLAPTEPSIAERLRPVREFFAIGKRAPKDESSTPQSPPPA